MPTLGYTITTATALPPGWYNVKDYGALGDNSHDDTAAIQAAMNALKANISTVTSSMGGQTLYFPPGYYKTTAKLDFTGLAEVRILGGSGRGSWHHDTSPDGNPPTVIAPSQATGIAVDMGECSGIVWDGVSIITRGLNYSGVMLNFDATAAHDIFGNRVQNCVLRNYAGSGGVTVSMAGNIEVSFDNVTFMDSPGGTQVRMVNPSAAATWSNANSFRSCSFIGNRTTSVLNPGPQTTFIDCTFEPASGGVTAPINVTQVGNEDCTAVSFIGCGFWDNTGTGSWFTSSVATSAWAFTGCKITLGTSPAFSLSSHTGLALNGCSFDGAGGGAPNIFDPAHTITGGVMNGCRVKSPVVDNHSTVFV
jgi:hypothetical protein